VADSLNIVINEDLNNVLVTVPSTSPVTSVIQPQNNISIITAANSGSFISDVLAGLGIAVTQSGSSSTVSLKNAANFTNSTILKWNTSNGQFSDSIITDIGTKIGINQSSPTANLHVEGDLRLTEELYDSTNAAGTNGQVLTSTGSGIAWSDSVADKTQVFNVTVAATVWDLTHSLNKYPSITTVTGTDDNQVYGVAEYVSTTRVKITFSTAITGKAFLN